MKRHIKLKRLLLVLSPLSVFFFHWTHPYVIEIMERIAVFTNTPMTNSPLDTNFFAQAFVGFMLTLFLLAIGITLIVVPVAIIAGVVYIIPFIIIPDIINWIAPKDKTE